MAILHSLNSAQRTSPEVDEDARSSAIPAVELGPSDEGEAVESGGEARLNVERELRFFARLSDIEDGIELHRVPCLRIEQHFFSGQQFDLLLAFANEIAPEDMLPTDLRLTQARIRRISGCEEEAGFFLELKGRQAHHSSLERLEFSVPIKPSSYRHLLRAADGGSMVKRRYRMPGVVSKSKKQHASVTAEIDVMEKLGALESKGTQLSRNHDFVTVDIEVPDRSFVEPLRDGKHTLDFLLKAIDLTSEDKKIQKALSSQRMARKGLDRRAVTALDQLRERCVKPST